MPRGTSRGETGQRPRRITGLRRRGQSARTGREASGGQQGRQLREPGACPARVRPRPMAYAEYTTVAEPTWRHGRSVTRLRAVPKAQRLEVARRSHWERWRRRHSFEVTVYLSLTGSALCRSTPSSAMPVPSEDSNVVQRTTLYVFTWSYTALYVYIHRPYPKGSTDLTC